MEVKTIAKRHGFHATFMPKPKEGVNGSGMHINMSLADVEGNNVFADRTDPLGLSRTARQFMAGVLCHMNGMAILTNPLVNSYKRLIPGYDAPVTISWSEKSNRSSLLRIPSARGSKTRIELRCPDSAANPYLVLAVCLAAGLDGIKNEMEVPKSLEGNVFCMDEEILREKQVKFLPKTLGEAIVAFEKDVFLKEVLGAHIFEQYLKAKKKEWRKYCAAVTDWELDEYLYRY